MVLESKQWQAHVEQLNKASDKSIKEIIDLKSENKELLRKQNT